MNRAIGFRFDGTVNSFESGWCGATSIPDGPFGDVIPLIARLIDEGVTVFVLSDRLGYENGYYTMFTWFVTHGLGFDRVRKLKFVHVLPAGVGVIDRCAYGWPGVLPRFEQLVPEPGAWNEPYDTHATNTLAEALTLAAAFLHESATEMQSE